MVATVGALSVAFKRMQQRDTIGYQRWLRARVLAQGLTIVAIVVAGVQEVGVGVLTGNAYKKKQQVTAADSAPWEHQEFEKRLRAAEEAHRVESGETVLSGSSAMDTSVPSPTSGAEAITSSENDKAKSGSSWSSWLGWSRK